MKKKMICLRLSADDYDTLLGDFARESGRHPEDNLRHSDYFRWRILRPDSLTAQVRLARFTLRRIETEMVHLTRIASDGGEAYVKKLYEETKTEIYELEKALREAADGDDHDRQHQVK